MLYLLENFQSDSAVDDYKLLHNMSVRKKMFSEGNVNHGRNSMG